jgi:hypothetical protein
MPTDRLFRLPAKIHANADGFATLHDLHRHLLACADARIDASSVEFMAANLAAPLLALLDHHRPTHRWPLLEETLPDRLRDVLTRNAFLGLYREEAAGNIVDERRSTIPLHRFAPSDADGFIDYLDSRLFDQHNVKANLDSAAAAEILGHYTEVFTNIEQHAATSLPVYACGQYYPNEGKPQGSQVAFTLVDRGRGFLPAIAAREPTIADGAAAIAWAASGHTTKGDDHPGGRGLSSICNYCRQSEHAYIQIYSSGAFWQYDGRQVKSRLYAEPWLPVTVITLLFHDWQATHPEGY